MTESIVNILSLLLMLCVIPAAGLVYKKKISFFTGVFLGTFLFLVSEGCSLYSTYIVYGQSPADVLINSAFGNILNAYTSVPGITAADLQTITIYIEQVKNLYSLLLPAVLILGNLLWVYIFFMLSKGILAIFRKDVSAFTRFSELKMPGAAVVLGVLSYIASMIIKNHPVGYAFLNFSIIILTVCTVCGFSLLDFALRKKVKYSVLRILIYIPLSVLLTGIGGSILGLAAVLDSVFDYRKLNPKPDDNV